MQYDVSVKEVQPQVVLARHVVVDQVDLGTTIGSTMGEAYGFLATAGIQPAGPPFVTYHKWESGRWEADICAPASYSLPDAPPGFVWETIDGGLAATTLHRGAYAGLAAAYGAIADWAKDHDFTFAGAPREIYMSEPGTPEDEIETIVEWPVVHAGVPAPVGA